MDLITVDEFVFNGTPHQLQAALDKFRYQNYGNFYALRNADDTDLAPDAAGYSVSLRSAKNGKGVWLHAAFVGGQSKIAVLADEAVWSLHKPSWEVLRAYIDEHMATDELAHIKDPNIHAAVRAYIDRQPGETRATIAARFDCDPSTITRNLPDKYKDKRKAR